MNKTDEIYDLLAYIASSAKEMHKDPGIYAPLRLLTVMLRFIKIVQRQKDLDHAFLRELERNILDNRSLLLKDREGFDTFLDDLVMTIASKNFP